MVKSPAYIIYNGIVSRRRKIIKCDRKKNIHYWDNFAVPYIIHNYCKQIFLIWFFFLKCDGILYKLTNINNNLALISFWKLFCDLSIVSDSERLVKGIFFVLLFFGCFDDCLAVFDDFCCFWSPFAWCCCCRNNIGRSGFCTSTTD